MSADTRRIIVVDDEEDLREPVVEYLCAEGLAAEGAGSGAELDALMAAGGRVCAVVLDVNMPGENGFSIARRLRPRIPCSASSC
jgi:DNA-binding response OmpR family regulator